MPDPNAVNSMFGRIAFRYDLANRVLSGGIDIYWRFRLAQAVRRQAPATTLDLATGSGDVAFKLHRELPESAKIIGMDFCAPMLDQAKAKQAAQAQLYPRVSFVLGDALDIPLPAESVDAVTIAFGIRNTADRARCLSEIRRVLRPGGKLYILEFSQAWALVRPVYHLHLKHIAPAVAGWLTGDRAAYEYLGQSIDRFPPKEGLRQEMIAAGFEDVRAEAMTFGVVALHIGRR